MTIDELLLNKKYILSEFYNKNSLLYISDWFKGSRLSKLFDYTINSYRLIELNNIYNDDDLSFRCDTTDLIHSIRFNIYILYFTYYYKPNLFNVIILHKLDQMTKYAQIIYKFNNYLKFKINGIY